jgi:Dolichyl-phosphate-mannose-protein mannosyltransferase
MPEDVVVAANSTAPRPPLKFEIAAAAAIALVACTSLAFFYVRGLSNLYGDGIAHMEGARRIFDSLTPGYAEIGSVWLPLYHLIVAPLAINDFFWRTGLGGSLVSTAAFIIAAWVLFRLAYEMNGSLAAAAVALAGFLLCPNMLYLASTPLTEPLALLWTVLVIYGLFRYQQNGRRLALVLAGLSAFLGTLTRYDGWFLLPFAAFFVLLARPDPWSRRFRHAAIFSVIAGAGPALWLLHNSWRFGNALEFVNGPYSAQAIYARQLATTAFKYPTDGSLIVSIRYYLADLELVIGVWPIVLALLGLLAWIIDRENRARRSAALLFLVLLPFYVFSLAYAAIPLYVPTLFPNTYYNLRYGLEMLPAVALLPSFLIITKAPSRLRRLLTGVLIGVILAQAVVVASSGAADLAVAKEGVLNTPCRSPRQQLLIRVLKDKYDGRRVLVAVGKWPCVMPAVGISFRDTLSETNRAYWRRLRTDPGKWVAWIIRGDGDAVDELMLTYPQAFADFELIASGSFPDEGSVAVYRLRK